MQGTDWLSEMNPTDVVVERSDLEFVQIAHKTGFLANLRIKLNNSTGLGSVMCAVQARGIGTIQRYDDTIELVLPNPVSAGLIERIVPLYRTNKQFRQDRQQRDSGAE
jgi:hypothetical protein